MPKRKTSNPSEKLLVQIRDGLGVLRLGQIQVALDECLAHPNDDDGGRLAWLWRLLEPQVQYRLEGRMERRIRESRMPERKTLEAFDFGFQAELDRDVILGLATLQFIEQGKNILLAGMSGTGKSHIAKALGLLACGQNRRVLYTESASMLGALNASLADGSLADALKAYTRAELLIIDEVGLEEIERKEAHRSGLMQKVLLPRYNKRRSTIVTSNIPWEAWGDYLDDHLGAAALLDRLLHHSHVIVINGPSYREWAHRQEVDGADTET